jgi:hypothetical protein
MSHLESFTPVFYGRVKCYYCVRNAGLIYLSVLVNSFMFISV